MDRSQRRQAEKSVIKAEGNGLAKRYLDRAQSELSLGTVALARSAQELRNDFIAALYIWQGIEQSKSDLRLSYQTAEELTRRGKKGIELVRLRENYANVLQEQEIREEQMTAALQASDELERGRLLVGPHVWIPTGMTIPVSEALRERLERACAPPRVETP